MSKHCVRCNIDIVDDAVKCPLCDGVLADMEDDSDETPGVDQMSKSITYPDVSVSVRMIQFVIRAAIFAAIVAEVVVLVVNYFTFNGVYWSLIVGIGLLYGVITLLYSVRKRKSMQRIILVQLLLSILLVVALDVILGYKGWSVGYAIPIALMAVDVSVVVFMIVGINDWQTYIMTEITAFVLSVILIVLHLTNLVDTSFFALIAFLVTGFILLGTILFGQNMISNEIKRRFHI
ncbi:MAG: hypothetical protein K6E10_04055 [Eubacterium sp.]|nr:hypothetical protein [Eubacterium sp.]